METPEVQATEEFQKHDFRILLAPCNVTGEQAMVISVMLGTIDRELPDGTVETGQVWGNFSAEGLAMMQRALAESAFPVDIPTPEGTRAELTYRWVAAFRDGTELAQFPGDHHFGEFNPHDVQRLTIEPRDPERADLPRFVWHRELGFLHQENAAAPLLPLCEPNGRRLPFPGVPCHLEYDRRVRITFAAGPIGSDVFPTHVTHQLGWRVDTLHGDPVDTVFLIAIEDDDGAWQIVKQEPEDSRHFQHRVIHANVRIVDMVEGVVG